MTDTYEPQEVEFEEETTAEEEKTLTITISYKKLNVILFSVFIPLAFYAIPMD